jgi:uncharacterized membrane protein YbhN (UPF0104 family)
MANPSNSIRNVLLRWVLPAVLAAVLLYFSLRGVEWGRVWSAIAGAHWQYLLAGALFSCCSSFLRSLRWRMLLNSGAHFDVMTVFWAMMAGYLGNNFLPARAGELVRTFLISSRSTLTRTYVLTTALSERMMDAIALVLWSSLLLLGIHPKPDWLDKASRTGAIFAGAGLAAVIVLPHTGNVCEAVIRRLPLPHGLRDKLLHLAEQILLGLRTFHSVKRFGGFAAFTLVIWCLDAAGATVAARALDLHLPFAGGALLMCGLGLGSALPSTPGYVGIYQFVTVQVLTVFHIEKDAALAFSFVSQAMGYLVVLALGLPGLYRFKDWRTAVAQTG